MFQISGFYLKYKVCILPETSPFLSAQIVVLSSFFQMFIVLGMYNFEITLDKLKRNLKNEKKSMITFENLFFISFTIITHNDSRWVNQINFSHQGNILPDFGLSSNRCYVTYLQKRMINIFKQHFFTFTFQVLNG